MVLLAVAVEGYWVRSVSWVSRGMLFAAALLMFVPGWESRVAGLAIAVPLLYLLTRSSGPRPRAAQSP